MSAHQTITISGPPGSGTTTLARLLADQLGLRYVNTGQIFRDLAAERGLSLAEFGLRAERDPAIDAELDRRAMALAAAGGIVLEGRLAGHCSARDRIPALRVYLDARPEIRAARLAGRDRLPAAEALRQMDERAALERRRYLAHYGLDLLDTAPYDLRLDSSAAPPEQLAAAVRAALGAAPGA